jgi:hypothetical protein
MEEHHVLVGVAVLWFLAAAATRVIKIVLQLAEHLTLITGRDKAPRLAAPDALLSFPPILNAFLPFPLLCQFHLSGEAIPLMASGILRQRCGR